MSQTNIKSRPIVMSFAGHDPSGGAGIQADIETLSSLGCHCTPIITALTAQDSVNVKDFKPLAPTFLIEQARAILEDMPVAAFKIGMLGDVANTEAIHTLLLDYPDIPVVLDPILSAGGGTILSDERMVQAIKDLLLPYTTIATPNSVEARKLSVESDTLDACAQGLFDNGCQHVLISGGHESGETITNRLWNPRRLMDTYEWPRLPGQYHGSGCTLAAAIAGYLAHGASIETAVRDAQQFTHQALTAGSRLGMGQHIPNRFFWA